MAHIASMGNCAATCWLDEAAVMLEEGPTAFEIDALHRERDVEAKARAVSMRLKFCLVSSLACAITGGVVTNEKEISEAEVLGEEEMNEEARREWSQNMSEDATPHQVLHFRSRHCQWHIYCWILAMAVGVPPTALDHSCAQCRDDLVAFH